jgi:hypothetical protein
LGSDSLGGGLSTNDIQRHAAALAFAEEWAEEQGYEFRGPRVGIQ